MYIVEYKQDGDIWPTRFFHVDPDSARDRARRAARKGKRARLYVYVETYVPGDPQIEYEDTGEE